MRLTQKMLLLFAVGLCLIALVLSSFQKPQDQIALKKQVERWASQRILDSLLHYQNLLQKLLAEEGTEDQRNENGQQFLNHVLNWNQLSEQQELEFIDQYPSTQAWKQAYRVQFFLKQNELDSAAFYFEKLETSSDNRQALIYGNCWYARYFSTNTKNFQAAYNYLRKAETASQEPSDSLILYSAQAVVYSAIGYFDEGVFAAKRMIQERLAKKYVDSIGVAFLYQDLANSYLKKRDYNQAKNYSGEAINYIADRANYDLPTARMWYNLATCYYNFENKSLEAILYLRKVFSLLGNSKEATTNKVFVDACNLIALQFLKLEEIDSAQTYVNKAQEIQKKLPYKVGHIWSVQAQIYALKLDRKEATAVFQKAVKKLEIEVGVKHFETTNCLLRFGKWLLQEKDYSQALRQLDKALWSTSTLEPKGKLPASESIFSKSKAIETLTTKVEAMLVFYEKSKYNVSLKDIHAHTLYNLDLMRTVRQQNNYQKDFLDVSISVYVQGIEACLLLHSHHKDTSYLHQAFDLGEQAKELLLQESLKEPENKGFGAVSTTLLQEERLLEERIAWYQQVCWQAKMEADSLQVAWCQAQIDILKTDLEQTREKLTEADGKYVKFRNKSTLADLDSIQLALSDSTVLVQYLEGKNAIFQFVICSDTFAVRKIFWRTYKPTILKYYKHFTDSKLIQHNPSGGYKDFCLTSYELYHKLMHHELLNGKEQLILIPDGLMHYIPFGTLLTELPLDSVHQVDFPNLSFLLKQKDISYNYSTTIWWNDLKEHKSPINHEILGMGVTYEDQEVPAFRSAQHQAWRTKYGVFEGARAQMDSFTIKYAGDFYTNRYASEYYLKQYSASYGIIHLAMQGIIAQEKPEFSNLMLAEDGYKGEDNFLTTNEIKQLKLNTSMVVLANCETGYGQRQKGEGLLSLGMSFLYAGNPALVLTLWQQDALASAQIVNYFYENLQQKMPKDKALRLAKLRYLKGAQGMNSHPNLWAGFVQFGNTDAIEVSEPVTHIWWFIFPIAFLGFLGWWSMQALRQRRS